MRERVITMGASSGVMAPGKKHVLMALCIVRGGFLQASVCMAPYSGKFESPRVMFWFRCLLRGSNPPQCRLLCRVLPVDVMTM
jgi:hypothetical protein